MHDPQSLETILTLYMAVVFFFLGIFGYAVLRLIARYTGLGPSWLSGRRAEPPPEAEPSKRESPRLASP